MVSRPYVYVRFLHLTILLLKGTHKRVDNPSDTGRLDVN
jgi:hypothetical protein